MVRMKALSVRQPYAAWIVKGEKTVEWRSWRTDYRGPLAICTPPKHSPELLQYLNGQGKDDGYTEEDFPAGVALGIVELLDCVPFTWEHLDDAKLKLLPNPPGWAWVVKSFGRFKEMQPVRGELHIFEIDLPEKKEEPPKEEEPQEGPKKKEKHAKED